MKYCKPMSFGELWSAFKRTNPAVASKLSIGKLPEEWAKLVGYGITAVTTDLKLRGTTLYVSVSSGVARQELFMRRAEIVESLNGRLGGTYIKQMMIR